MPGRSHEDDLGDNDGETVAVPDHSSKPNKMNVWNNSKTMNLSEIVHKNILQSQYFKDLYELTTYQDVLNELLSSVDNLSPTKGPNSTQPSHAICLLYKLFTLKLTRRQIEAMLTHKNSFVKAMGLLYVRLTVLPKEQWDFYKNLVDSEQKVEYLPKEIISIGEFTVGIIRDQRFLRTILLPRIPGQLLNEIDGKIEDILESKRRRRDAADSSRRRDRSPDRRKRRRSTSPDDHRDAKRGRGRYDRRWQNDRSEQQIPSSPPRSPPESRFGMKPIAEFGKVYSDVPQAENPYMTSDAFSVEGKKFNYATTTAKKKLDWRKYMQEDE